MKKKFAFAVDVAHLRLINLNDAIRSEKFWLAVWQVLHSFQCLLADNQIRSQQNFEQTRAYLNVVKDEQ